MTKYFGTDGIREIAGEKLNKELCYTCGYALTKKKSDAKVVIGCDTRLSNNYITLALALGIVAGGGKVIDIGICPTPCIAYITKLLGYDYGVSISASHNPPEYNGIKIFDCDGFKLSPEEESELEKYFFIDEKVEFLNKGNFTQKFSLVNKYTDNIILNGVKLQGLKVVLDCGFGASYRLAPKIFKKLGARVIKINCTNEGKKINEDCGAVNTEMLSRAVKYHKADVGFAFDGDADRIIAVDENGNEIDGDLLLYVFATHLKQSNKLNNDCVVGTVYTNMAIENELKKKGIRLLRAEVGDKFLTKTIVDNQLSLGAEKSGHVVFYPVKTTGDGMFSAVMLTNILQQTKKPLSSLCDVKLYPQICKNVVVNDKSVLHDKNFRLQVDECKKVLGDNARLYLRASGTEPKIRIMIETQDEILARHIFEKLAKIIKQIDDKRSSRCVVL